MLLNVLLLILGFALLVKGADLFVEAASAIARRLNVSDMMIGLTVVAFGTSTPELFVNIFASINGNADLAIGNVIGSNISNIFLILGISGLVFPLAVPEGTVRNEIPLALLAALLLGILANDGLIDSGVVSIITRTDGLVMLVFFCVFLYYLFSIGRRRSRTNALSTAQHYDAFRTFVFAVLGLLGLILGGKMIVNSALKLALAFHMSESFVGLSIVALGTSLPELGTSAMAAAKKNPEIAVGNVVGSNIFNIFLVLGVSAFIRPLPVQPKTNADIAFVILASILLFAFMYTGKRHMLDRWEGAIFVILYVVYLVFLFIRG